jgi:hypothetical protein
MQGIDERVHQLQRTVRNEANKYVGEIKGLRDQIKGLPGLHRGPGSEHGIAQETAQIEHQIAVLQDCYDENEKAMKSLDQGLVPKGGSSRWWARDGYQCLFSECHKHGLVDHNNSLSK